MGVQSDGGRGDRDLYVSRHCTRPKAAFPILKVAALSLPP